MARAIDAEVAKKRLQAWIDESDAQGFDKEATCFQDCISLLDAVPTLAPQNEWVSVEDRLPEPTYCVLVYTTDHSIEVDALDSDGEWMSYEVTHWMLLPKSPKEDE